MEKSLNLKLMENWKILLAFFAVLLVIALVSFAITPLDYVDEAASDPWEIFDFSVFEETETPQGIKSPEEIERELFIKGAKEKLIPFAAVCGCFGWYGAV